MRTRSVPDVKFCLVFQCELLSVPVMRRVLGDTLRGLGVDEDSVYDILLAATEACTNVLLHGGRAGPGLRGGDQRGRRSAARSRWPTRASGCRPGARAPGRAPARRVRARRSPIAQLPESGRGLAVMRACVDNVTLDSQPGRGTVVTLRKHIRWSQDAPLRPVHQQLALS